MRSAYKPVATTQVIVRISLALTCAALVLPHANVQRAYAATVPAEATLIALAAPPLGQNFSFDISFDNVGGATGYGPYLNLFMPVAGADGGASVPNDGIDLVSATFLGSAITTFALNCPAGGSVRSPLTGLTVTCPIAPAGTNKLYVLQLPFGSFTAPQAPAVIVIAASVSNLADVGVPLPISAQAGFIYGDSPTSLEPSQGVLTTTTVAPSLFMLTKTSDEPEGETATGRNFERIYTLTPAMPAGIPATNIVITETLPPDVVLVSVSGASVITGPAIPGGPYAPPNNQLVFNYGPLVGSGAPITLRYYISRTNALGADVLPVSGGNSPRTNTITGSGTWAPLDPRDASSPITATTSLTTTNRTLALQKSVNDPTPPTRPADVLTYTLNFQLSDFFSLGTIFITDTFADGQSYVPGSAALSVNERGSTVAGAFPAAALAVTNLGGAGTRMVFNVSQALPLLGATDGVLQGGAAISGAISPTTGPAVGTLTYRVQVNDVYASGNSLLSTDRLSNTAVLAGNVLSNTNPAQVIGSASDTAAAGFQVLGQPTLSKSFYAINGSTMLPSPLKLSPGDSVTYRIIYTIGTGDFNNLTVTDFLPLPVHDAALITSFISNTAGIPADGVVQWGPGMSASDLSRVPLPTLTNNAASNGFALGFGSRQDTTNTPSQIDLLFTSRVQDKPFLDNLFLTNQANTEQTNSSGQPITRNAIQPFTSAAPRVRVRKGIVGSSNPGSVLTSTAGPVAFAPVGTAACAARFVGTINSLNHSTNPIDANLQNADAGDVIRMAILAENIGSALQGAFDVAVSDALPANMSFVPGSLCVQRGDGAILPTSSPSTSLFTTGITVGVPLSQGVDYAGAANSTGSNLALFTFDVLVATPISPSQTLTNSMRLLNYASQSGAANFVPTQLPNTPVTDTAQVSFAPLRFGKQLIGTELTNANNSAAQAAIGELITYTLVLTVPEGTTPNARITDTLPTGLAFATCTGVAASSGVASTLALSPASTCSSNASGAVIAFDLGTLTNSNTNDAVTETLQVTYTAVVLNVGANVTGTTRTNNAQFNWAGNTPLSATASAITVIEPRLLATKASNLRFGDAFDALTFTIMVTNPATNSTDAYDAVLTDVIPSGMSYVAGSLTAVSGPVPSFQIAAPAFTATWPVLAPGQTSVMTFAVTIDPGVVPGTNLTNTARLNGSSLPGNVLARTTNVNSTERSYTASNASAVFIVNPPTSGKALVNTEISMTVNTRTQVAIGEVLTYSVVITVPEGVTPNARLTDTLDTGLAFVGFVDIAASAALQFANPVGSYLTPTVQAFSGEAGRRGVWAFGTLTNTNNNNAISETLRITYTAIALNVSNNTAGTNRRNSAVLGWSSGALAAALAQNVTIIEPRMGVTKSVTPTTGDSGDVITYTIVITGPSGTDAFDTTLTDRLPFTTGSSLLLNPAIASVNTNATPALSATNFAIAGSNSVGYTLTSVDSFDLSLNASRRITVVLTGTLPVVVVPSAFFTNTAVVTFTSLSGFAQPITRSLYNPNSTERVYTATGAAPFRILPLLATKEFITTSEGFTGNGADGNGVLTPRVAIGEVVAYRLWIQLAESTSPNLTIDFVDNLPVNLEFITGTTRMAFVTNGGTGGITSTLVTPSTPGCGGLNVNSNSVGSVLPTLVTCPVPANAISFDVNGRPRFAFGGVSNFDTDADGEFIIVQFSAVVKNQAGNQSGVNITNTFNVLINGGLADDSPPITTTVAEPALALSKAVSAVALVDAGDLITYTLAYSNVSGPNASTAFDVVLTDTLDVNLDLQRVSLNAPANPISYTNAGNAVITTSNALTVSVAQLDPGASVTVLVVSRVRAATSNGTRLPDTAFISYSSLPTTTGTIDPINNPTGTTTPGASGSITGERTGAGGVNDYLAQSNTVTTTLNTPTLAKLAPISSTYAIGEAITYTLVITVPEGVAQAVSVLDDLPSGLLPISSQVISTSYNGVVPSATPDFANGDVLYAFGPVTTTADNLSDNNAFVVQVVARVADVPANVNGTQLTNTARLTYTHPVSGVTDLSSGQSVRVVEPSLQTSKHVFAPRNPVGAGDVVTYTIFVTNTGTAAAFDLVVMDALPSGVNFVELVATSNPVTTTLATSTITVTPATGLSAGASLAITFTARITDSIGPNQLLVNSTQSTYSTLSGAQTGERSYTTTQATAVLTTGLPALSVSKASSANGVARPGERITYTITISNAGDVDAASVSVSDTLPANTSGADFAASNLTVTANTEVSFTYSITALQPLLSGTQIVNRVTLSSPTAARDIVTATAAVTDVIVGSHALSISKAADAATVIAGTRLAYTIAYTLTGTEAAQDVTIVDTLPASVTLVSAVPTVTTQIDKQLTWKLGTQLPITNYQLLITILVPADIPTGTLLSNSVSITDSNGGVTSTAAVTTPVLALSDPFIGKFAGPDPLVAGETLTFTLVFTNSGPSDAQNVVITDSLPNSVAYGGIVSAVPNVKPVVNGNVLEVNIGTLAAGASGAIVFTATVNLDAGAVITNEATITTPTPDANPINNTARSTTRVTYADVFVRKDVLPTAPVLAGEVLTWTITFGNAGDAVAREVSIVDVLPSGARTANPFTYTITSTDSATITFTYTPTPTRATWQLGDLPPGASGQIVFTMTVDAATGLDAILINSVSINTTTPQTQTQNDTARTTNPKLDLGVSKTVARNPVAVGELVSYTLTVYNNGASELASVALTDTFDAAHVQFVSASRLPDVNTAGQLAWDNVGPIAIDARASVIVTFTALQPTHGLTTVNAVTATGQFTGTSPLSVKDTAALRITQPLLSVSKASSANGFVQPGQRITYTLLISNAGDSDALGVALSDTLPANTLGENFSVSGITVRAYSQLTFTYNITTLQPLANGTHIVNTVRVTSSNSKLLTPTATVTDTISRVVFGTDLNILKSVEPSVVANGGLVTFTLVVSNPGPSDIAAPEPITIPGELANTLGPAQPYPASIVVADDVQITDITVTLAALRHGFGADLDVLLVGPNGQRVLLMSDAGGIHFIGNVSLNFHDGAPALPDIDPIPSGVYAPTDYVGNDTIDTLPAPAPARPYGELLSVFKGTNAKGEWKLFIYDDQDNDVGGALRGWALTLATTQGNQSYSFAQGMRVLDTLPPGLTLVSASPGYAGPNPVAWVDGIRAGETRTYMLTARANRAGSAVATNTAVVTSPLPELNLSDNTSSAEVLINSASLTVITPTLPVTPTPPGGVLTITIPISNSGNITATGGVITITLPNGEVLVFPIDDIPPGTGTTVEITVTVPILPPGTTVVDIVITVGSSGVDATPEDNTLVVSAPVDSLPRLVVAKTADPPAGTSVRVGDRINYTLLVTNVGAVTATNVILTDAIPLNTSYVAGTAQPMMSSSNPFVWRLPSLAARAVFTAQFSVVVMGVGTGTHPITNVAVLGGDLLTPTRSNPVLHVYLPSAIRLLSFTAQNTAGGVQVAWATGAEVNTFGFALYRSATGVRADAVRVTDELIAAKGASGASYGWLDVTAEPEVSYTYWLQEIETSGRVNEYGPTTVTAPNQPQTGASRVFLPLVMR